MKKFKKTLSTLLVITVVASILIAGTLAYLTKDAGKATNVFSVGDIDVTLDEEVAVIGQGGEVKEVEDGAKYEGIMPGDYLQKEVTVTNNGSTPAYVAVTVDVNNFSQIRDAIESYGEDNDKAEDMLDYVFDGWGLTVKDRLVDGKKDMSYKVNEFVDSSILHVDSAKRIVASEVAHFSMNNWFKSEAEAKATGYTVAGTGNSFYLEDADDYSLRFTYYIHLNGGASATLFKGLNVPAEFKADQMKMFDGLEINVSAKAIQADNMGIAEAYKNEDESTAKAKTAFAILHGLVSEDDVNVNNSPNKIVGYQVNNDEEFATAIEAGETEIWLNPGSYTIPEQAKAKTLVINGTKDAIVKMGTDSDNYDASDYNLDGSTVTFNGITHQAATGGSAQGYARATLTFNKCDLSGYMDLPMAGKASFTDCVFDVSGDLYCIWTWGTKEVFFTNCTFNTDGKAILVYNSDCDVHVTNCTFNDRTNGTGFTKSAIETGADYGSKKYNIYITNTTVNGFAENNVCVGYKNIVGNKNNLTQEYLNIVVDGVDVY